MWLYFGNGHCQWTESTTDIPSQDEVDKTLLVGFPSGDKRIVFTQMEGLTGLKTKDSWDLDYAGMTNDPFVKGNYPHPEGVWGWQDTADQVVLAVRNIKLAMIEYHALRSKLHFSTNYEEAALYRDLPYLDVDERIADFETWCNNKVLGEIKRYGWFIDFWMEGGLLRDSSTNDIISQTHWGMLREPLAWTQSQVEAQHEADVLAGITPTYDAHCQQITGGCAPIAVIDADAVVNSILGPQESRRIALLLNNTAGVKNYLIDEDAWECIWEELIVNDKNPGYTRLEYIEGHYHLAPELLLAMNHEIIRLTTKYGGEEWEGNEVAARLVDILNIHRTEIISDWLETQTPP